MKSIGSYLRGLDNITSARRSTVRAVDVLGAAGGAALVKRSSIGEFMQSIKDKAPPDVDDGIGTLIGAGVGGVLWARKGHPWLGAVAGASLGRNIPALLKTDQRKLALHNMSITAAGVLGSLMVPQHPVAGFVLGWLSGGAVTYAARL